MFKETIDCIDAGSEYCPCHLAESGDCILCSQLHGSCFCDCSNWKGVCIYQEFKYNGEKAKEGRKTFNCLVEEKLLYENDVLLIKFKAPHKLAIDLVKPGGYIFIRTDPNVYFDVPISILESDIETNIITIMIEVRGIKTKKLLGIEKGGEITIRGPYWNGVFGLKNIQKQKNRNVLIISRGIGMAPMMPVIQKFTANNNKVYLLLDKEPYKDNYVKEYLDKYNVTPIFMNTIDKGDISSECKYMINTFISEKNISNIHIAGADILTYKIIDYMNEINNTKVLLSCCNNTKMCCGEGICGSCTTRFSGHRVKRFCKVQADPRNVFEGRRFI
ncbi:sulfide/dihydroorotate dehydrogenase-like FAD/NAD-binding protein [Clostridium gasigenes]|uniref:sulfide/dihydroorotate dehydrogenase-like FAD/NAD-binding protein n=1 Tax=Clostridium gasigenes TaxID=94869 RepID=UPI0014386BF0|nr:sulfide/dihydroorotate dehydrogenase-like FAD/NAD-binding protein [Clostridium gasigenes]NKF05368.1 sulfide/dihydroorotate dehydrogenase-like FAD/NAD-binding protein [Clostridium gasigenes]QSW18818.1 sulfide/dihydroorotate dehydrogenase-like FAD/NAD-binding protein [Clostridium gasigenes]